MKLLRTICCKLLPTSKQTAEIDRTLVAFAKTCNQLATRAREAKTRGRLALQKLAYHETRKQFKLPANLVIRAIARVTGAKEISVFAPTSVGYDSRIFRFHEGGWSFGQTLLGGRRKLATNLSDFQRATLAGKKPTSATLVKRKGQFFLHVQIKEAAPAEIPISGFPVCGQASNNIQGRCPARGDPTGLLLAA